MEVYWRNHNCHHSLIYNLPNAKSQLFAPPTINCNYSVIYYSSHQLFHKNFWSNFKKENDYLKGIFSREPFRESWLTVVFDTDAAASSPPVYANQTQTFAYVYFTFWSQSQVNLRTSSIYCVLSTFFIHLYVLISIPFVLQI